MFDVGSLKVEGDDDVIGISCFIDETGIDDVTIDFDIGVVDDGSDVDSATLR